MASYEKSKGRASKSGLQGKLNGNSFTPLRHDLVASPEFNALSLSAKAVFIAFLGKFNGFNNGSIAFQQTKEQAEKLNISDRTLRNAIKELIEADFIKVTKQGYNRSPSLYALTCYPINETKRKGEPKQAGTLRASDLWRKAQPH
ncbi:ArsR family transcriptional regulator [Mannheimia indoligenes]|uniref:ArsR family transcriptional regulator n=1 Tax=Mannheimia indoligenes TaxID=3103145 RepID=UPI002FE64149